ncbi:hypothetical protein [Priestia megaterium]|uniref:hypothetical protein n=1 Tax=Priestia megaterium TaxID=1404 RepID=UPI001C12C2C2|nr:hypothetical protein [Priestia megaterium]
MNTVVTNSSPVISLARIGLFSVLEEIFEEIIVPFAVYEEVCLKHQTNKYGEMQLDTALKTSSKFKKLMDRNGSIKILVSYTPES